MKLKRALVPILCLSLFTVSQCWYYSFKGTLPAHIKTIAIPIFTDQTAEFDIQQIVTDQIRLGFIRENILKLADEERANSILYGVIRDIGDRPLVYQSTEGGEAVTEYRLTLKVQVEWYDAVEDKTVFKRQFTGFSEYDPTGSTERTREIALQESIDQITEDIINAILADW